LSLIRQVELLLVLNDVPSLIDENLQAIEWQVLIISFWEDIVIRCFIKPVSKLECCDIELILLENFMGKHVKFKVEEIVGFLVFKLFRLEDFGPDSIDIKLDLFHHILTIISLIVKVTKDEHQLLG
jgi:hypothetical protein